MTAGAEIFPTSATREPVDDRYLVADHSHEDMITFFGFDVRMDTNTLPVTFCIVPLPCRRMLDLPEAMSNEIVRYHS